MKKMELKKRKDIKNRNTNDEMYGFAHISISVGSKEKVDSLTE